jgi:hypothetical protein
MKMTLIFDTEDPKGIWDALVMAQHFYIHHRPKNSSLAPKETTQLSKIQTIRLARLVSKLTEQGRMASSLRDCKDFVEKNWTHLVAGKCP